MRADVLCPNRNSAFEFRLYTGRYSLAIPATVMQPWSGITSSFPSPQTPPKSAD
jgi:hypothetical protein